MVYYETGVNPLDAKFSLVRDAKQQGDLGIQASFPGKSSTISSDTLIELTGISHGSWVWFKVTNVKVLPQEKKK